MKIFYFCSHSTSYNDDVSNVNKRALNLECTRHKHFTFSLGYIVKQTWTFRQKLGCIYYSHK